MTERVLLLLAQASVLDALQDDSILETLGDMSPLSEYYAPTLQFLMRPDNLTSLVFSLLEEPPAPPNATAHAEKHERVEPTYTEYAIVYRAHWILCSSGFSSQLMSAIHALQQLPSNVAYQSLRECLVTYASRDVMNLEALTRFLNVFMDQYSAETLISFFGPTYDLRFMQSLLVLIHYEPIRDVLLRICNEIPDSYSTLRGLSTQLLSQLAPEQCCCGYLEDTIATRVRNDPSHILFSRMIFTCDLLTDLIHERRQGSLGHFFIQELNNSENHVSHLLDAVLRDLVALPTPMANESYVIKVLNSLLQQTQCGCVSKVAFVAAFKQQPKDDSEPVDDSELSPHVDLPLLWKCFIMRLPELLTMLAIGPLRRYKASHIQMIYLMLPILNVSCCAVDQQLMAYKTLEGLLQLIIRFPEANILHCAISRLYIVALEDSPFMFGKELPAFRTANDPLRLHLLLKGCFDMVVSAYDYEAPPPPAFIDIAISFDQAVTNAHAHSPHLISRNMMARWHEFRDRVLFPTQTKWEEQYQVAPASPKKPIGGDASELYDQSDCIMFAAQLPTSKPPAIGATIEPMVSLQCQVPDPPMTTATLDSSGRAGLDDVPTPLAALYNEDEKSMMLTVAGSAPAEEPLRS